MDEMCAVVCSTTVNKPLLTEPIEWNELENDGSMCEQINS